jgi:hypothetical protein
MIDTIKLAYPLDPELETLLERRSERLQRVSPDGEMLWEKSVVKGDCMPSHYSGLRITTRKQKDLVDAGFRVKARVSDVAFFEFSLQKYQSPSAYNNLNTNIDTDLKALDGWINDLSNALGYAFVRDRFELYRVDLSKNYLLLNAKPTDYLRSLELTFSKQRDSEQKIQRDGTGIYLRSRWLGKKIYYKGQEFLNVERKKRTFYSDKYCNGEKSVYTGELVPLSLSEINDLMRMIRFECEFKLMYLERHKMKKIKDIPLLCGRFEEENDKYMNVPVLVQGDLRLSAREEQVINLVRRVGYHEAKLIFIQAHSERSWYRIQRELKARSIHLEALDNFEYRTQGLETIINPERLEFQIVIAPYQEAA